MTKRRRGSRRAADPAPDPADQPEEQVDLADLGRQLSVYETNNGLAHGIIGTAVVVLAVLILRPVGRAFRAFLRG